MAMCRAVATAAHVLTAQRGASSSFEAGSCINSFISSFRGSAGRLLYKLLCVVIYDVIHVLCGSQGSPSKPAWVDLLGFSIMILTSAQA